MASSSTKGKTKAKSAPATGATRTKLENAESGFTASKALAESLQATLVDLIALHLVGKQAHWNIVGPNFRDLHLNLDELVAVAREGSDVIAERMRALHATADGRPAVVSSTTTLPELPQGEILTHDAIDLVVQAIEAAVGTMRRTHDAVDAADPTTADIYHGLIEKLEQQAWFISAETRTPAKAK